MRQSFSALCWTFLIKDRNFYDLSFGDQIIHGKTVNKNMFGSTVAQT